MRHIDFNNKKVLVRVDFNVPLNDQLEVTDTTRIEKAIPTLQYMLDHGAALIVCTHLGRPKPGADNSKYSTQHIVPVFSKLLGTEVRFVDDVVGEKVEAACKDLQPGQVLLLENTRFYKEETDGEATFSKALASLADAYVNDAFGTAHRAHASTTTVANYFDKDHKGFGFLMEAEVKNGFKVLKEAEKPFTAIVGGAKVSDKIQLLENLIEKADNILIGGGMAYTFFKAQGGQIGNSLCEADFLNLALEVLQKAAAKGCNIYLPQDSLAADKFAADAQIQTIESNAIPDGWMGLDIGPLAVKAFCDVIASSKTIVWNGPMGVFEFPNFANGTLSVAHAVADATKNGAFSLIGGGDSVAAINKAGLENEVSYVSTGGGAMLEMLEGKILPGVAAIED
ncbi:MAG TPA: phosphoglycerate kinase [Saprospiraceae bacterium]|nr:phosphoglycerate kinase [Saprospiraceae bacterium]